MVAPSDGSIYDGSRPVTHCPRTVLFCLKKRVVTEGREQSISEFVGFLMVKNIRIKGKQWICRVKKIINIRYTHRGPRTERQISYTHVVK